MLCTLNCQGRFSADQSRTKDIENRAEKSFKGNLSPETSEALIYLSMTAFLFNHLLYIKIPLTEEQLTVINKRPDLHTEFPIYGVILLNHDLLYLLYHFMNTLSTKALSSSDSFDALPL